jgi:hypothetical protein
MGTSKNLSNWIYAFVKMIPVSNETETNTHINRVEADSGTIQNKPILNAWVKLLKDNSVFANLVFSGGALYGYKADGSSRVGTIYNIKGTTSSHDAIQTTNNSKAIYNANAVNSKPGFSFQTAGNLYRGLLPTPANQANLTVYLVVNVTGTGRSTLFGLTASNTDNLPYNRLEYSLFRDVADAPFQFYRGAGSSFFNRQVGHSTINNTSFRVLMARVDSNGEYTLRSWGAGPVSSTHTAFFESLANQSSPNFIIGNRGNANPLAGILCEIHCFNGYHSDAVANNILDWLRNRYFETETITGLASTLPYVGTTEAPPQQAGTITYNQATTIPSHDSITWESPISNGLSFDGNGVCLIENRNFRSTVNGTPAVDLWADYTDKTIIFDNCKFSYLSWAGIKALGTVKAYIVVRNCVFYGRDSSDNAAVPRYALRAQFFKGVKFENNYVENSGGVLCAISTNASVTASFYEHVHFRYNKCKNVNGMMGTAANIVQTLQINDSTPNSAIDIDVRWNETENIEDQCHVEDNYNFYCASGKPTAPAKVEFNMVKGAFYKTRGTSYTGGGIILDSPSGANIASYWAMNWNVLIGVGNYCLGVASANNVTKRGNRGIVACQYADLSRYQFHTSGMWVHDYYNRGLTYNILEDGNEMGIEKTDNSRGALAHYNNVTNPNGDLPAIMRNNVTTPGDITKEMEAAELARWETMKTANNVVCGPMSTYTGALPGAPTISNISSTTVKYGDKITITGTNFNLASAVRIGGSPVMTFNIVSATQIDCFVAAHGSGVISVVNPSGTGIGPSMTYQSSPPIFTDFTPPQGAAGTWVAITGSNFTFVHTVYFDVLVVPHIRVDSGTIKFQVPAGYNSGGYVIAVENQDGSASSWYNFEYINNAM